MNDIDTLSDAIDKYYPEPPGTSGRELVSAIVEQKINDIISAKETNWSRLISRLKTELPDSEFIDGGFIQFPSYQLRFPLETESFKPGTHRSDLVITMSLLSPFYTSFIHHEYLFEEYDDEMPPRFSIIQPVASNYALAQNIQAAVFAGLEHEFPGVRNVGHMVLMMRTVPWIFPFPEYESFDLKNFTSSYYRLLFDGYFIESNYSIVG